MHVAVAARMHRKKLALVVLAYAFAAGCSGGAGNDPTETQRAAVSSRPPGGGARSDVTHVEATIPVGEIPHTSWVEQGRYHYKIPIRTLPGIAGSEPSVSLEYTSTNFNGVVGIGWKLDASSMIHRCRHELGRDGVAQPMQFMAGKKNQLCIGEQRLVPVSVTTGGTTTYETNDHDGVKYIATYDTTKYVDDPYSIMAYYPDGRILTYGGTAMAVADGRPRGTNGGDIDCSAKRWVYAWYLSSASTNGNAVYYDYDYDNVWDELSPQLGGCFASSVNRLLYKISYADVSVTFAYKSRTDIVTAYDGGFDKSSGHILDTIEVRKGPSQAPALAWKYALEYGLSPLTQRSELRKLTLSDAWGVAIPSTVFTWNNDATPAITSADLTQGMAEDTTSNQYATDPYALEDSSCVGCGSVSNFDWNTKGAWRDTTARQPTPVDWDHDMPLQPLVVADVNGDGFDDVALIGSAGTAYFTGGPNGLVRTTPSPGLANALRHFMYAVDLENAGYPQIVLKDGTVFDGRRDATLVVSDAPTASATNLFSLFENWAFADLTGDGSPDFIGMQPKSLPCTTDATAFAHAFVFRNRADPSSPDKHFYDLTGLYPNGVPYAPCTRYISGDLGEWSRFSPQAPVYGATNNLVLRDLDGDGRAEATSIANVGTELSTWDATFSRYEHGRHSAQNVFLGDFNGDGNPDAFQVQPTFPTPDQLACGTGVSLFAMHASFGDGRLPEHLSAGQNFVHAFSPAPAGCKSPSSVDRTSSQYATAARLDGNMGVIVGDFNGDGRDDAALLQEETPWTNPGGRGVIATTAPVHLLLSALRSVNGAYTPKFTTVRMPPSTGDRVNFNARLVEDGVSDLLGDSLSTLFQLGDSTANSLNVRGASLKALRVYQSPAFGNWAVTKSGDVNGDGIADLVQIVTRPGNGIALEVVRLKTTEIDPKLTHRHDVITKVEAGWRDANTWVTPELIQYDDLPRLAARGRYTYGTETLFGSTNPVFANRRRGTVVSLFKPASRELGTDTSVVAKKSITYSYTGDRYVRWGRTGVGFEKIVALDGLLGIEETKTQTVAIGQVPVWFDQDSLAIPEVTPYMTAANQPFVPTDHWLRESQIVRKSGNDALLTANIPYVSSSSTTRKQSNFLVDGATPTGSEPQRVTVEARSYDFNVEGTYAGGQLNGENTFYSVSPARKNGATARSSADVLYPSCSAPATCTGTSSHTALEVIKAWDTTARMPSDVELTTSVRSDQAATPPRTLVVRKTKTFQNDTSMWWFGRVTKEVTVSTLYDNSSASGSSPGTQLYQSTQVVGATFDSVGRILTSTVAPNDSAAPATTDETLTTKYEYYAKGMLQRITTSGIDASVDPNVVQHRTVELAYDGWGINPIRVTTNGNQVTTITWYEVLGAKIAEVDPNGVGVDYVIDGFGHRVGSVSDLGPAQHVILYSIPNLPGAIGARSQVAVDAPSCLLGTTWNGRCMVDSTKEEQNLQRQPLRKSRRLLGGSWFSDVTEYDMAGRVTGRMLDAPTSAVTFKPDETLAYDGLGRLISLKATGSHTEETKYQYLDLDTVRTTVVQSTGNAVKTVTKGIHQLPVRIVDDIATTTLDRDALGRLRNAKVGTMETNYTYDLRDRQKTNKQGSGTRWVNEATDYNAFGEPRHTVATGATPSGLAGSATQLECTMVHDDLARLKSRDCTTSYSAVGSTPAGSFVEKESFNYPALGNRLDTATSIARDGSTVTQTYGYDALMRVVTQTTTTPTESLTVSTSYDAVGSVATVTYPTLGSTAAFAVTYGYDPSTGTLNSAKSGATTLWTLTKATPTSIVEKGYDGAPITTTLKARDIASIEHNDLTVTTNKGRRIDYTYDDAGRVKTATSVEGVTNARSVESYGYDLAGRLAWWSTSPTGNGQGATLAYDYEASGALKRVRRFGTASQLTVPSGTPTSTITYSAANELGQLVAVTQTGSASTNYYYDQLGRRVGLASALVTGETIEYGSHDLPTAIRRGSVSTQTLAHAYLYDAFGARARALDVAAGITTSYAGNGVFEDRMTGTGSSATHDYVAHVMVNGRDVAQVTQSFTGTTLNTTSYVTLHADRKGSMVASVEGGTWSHRYYEPYGAGVDRNANPVARDPKVHGGFDGAELDASAFINMNGRIYDPKTRRFLTRDPIVAGLGSQAWDRYAYVHGRAPNATDPTGFDDTTLDEPFPNGCEDTYCFDQDTITATPPQAAPSGFVGRDSSSDAGGVESAFTSEQLGLINGSDVFTMAGVMAPFCPECSVTILGGWVISVAIGGSLGDLAGLAVGARLPAPTPVEANTAAVRVNAATVAANRTLTFRELSALLKTPNVDVPLKLVEKFSLGQLNTLAEETGLEIALIEKNGQTFLRSGVSREEAFIDTQSGTRLLAHTHPGGDFVPSLEDFEQMQHVTYNTNGGQTGSFIVTDRGWAIFGVNMDRRAIVMDPNSTTVNQTLSKDWSMWIDQMASAGRWPGAGH